MTQPATANDLEEKLVKLKDMKKTLLGEMTRLQQEEKLLEHRLATGISLKKEQESASLTAEDEQDLLAMLDAELETRGNDTSTIHSV